MSGIGLFDVSTLGADQGRLLRVICEAPTNEPDPESEVRVGEASKATGSLGAWGLRSSQFHDHWLERSA